MKWFLALQDESIIGGLPVESGSFTYQVYLFQISRTGSGEIHLCGGAIIGDFHIITAAHCVINDGNKFADADLEVIVGSIDGMNFSDANKFSVLKSYVLSSYQYGGDKDIAILKVRYFNFYNASF